MDDVASCQRNIREHVQAHVDLSVITNAQNPLWKNTMFGRRKRHAFDILQDHLIAEISAMQLDGNLLWPLGLIIFPLTENHNLWMWTLLRQNFPLCPTNSYAKKFWLVSFLRSPTLPSPHKAKNKSVRALQPDCEIRHLICEWYSGRRVAPSICFLLCLGSSTHSPGSPPLPAWDSPPEAEHKDVNWFLICYKYFFYIAYR